MVEKWDPALGPRDPRELATPGSPKDPPKPLESPGPPGLPRPFKKFEAF